MTVRELLERELALWERSARDYRHTTMAEMTLSERELLAGSLETCAQRIRAILDHSYPPVDDSKSPQVRA